MTESNNNTQTTVETENKVETKEAQSGAEKLFTQEEFDSAVKKATAKYYKRLEKFEADAEDVRINKEIRKLVAEGMNFEGDGESLLKALGDHYGKNGQQILEDYKNGDVTKREAEIKLEVLEFLNDDSTTDEDIVEEYEELADKPKSKLTKTDRIKLDMLSKRYFKIVSRKAVNNAEAWYKKNVGDNFDEFVGDEEFRDFIKDMNCSLDVAVKKYCKLKGRKKDESPKNKSYSPGSAKNYTKGNNPEFFTQEQVASMSKAEVKANLDTIIESEKHWKKG